MLDMTISWAYTLFFLAALCSVLGPQGSFGDLRELAKRGLACVCRLCKVPAKRYVSECAVCQIRHKTQLRHELAAKIWSECLV